ncbi:MAG: hypothetical protein ACXW3M_12945, partial [Rhodoplanes sp.]
RCCTASSNPMAAKLLSELENELPSGEVHSVEYMSAVATWCGFVSDGDAARPMDGILARPQQCAGVLGALVIG